MTGMPVNVCPPDCPGRNATCHTTCRTYLDAWEERQKVYEGRRMTSVISDVAYPPKRMTDNQRKNNWRRKKRN